MFSADSEVEGLADVIEEVYGATERPQEFLEVFQNEEGVLYARPADESERTDEVIKFDLFAETLSFETVDRDGVRFSRLAVVNRPETGVEDRARFD